MVIESDGLAAGDSVPLFLTGNVVIPPEFGLSDELVRVEIEGSLLYNGDYYSIEAVLSAVLHAECANCLDDCEYLLKIEISERLDEGCIFKDTNGKDAKNNIKIDPAPAVIPNLFMNIPMRMVCGGDCRGLCRICGKNLNRGDCGCDRTRYDPRFEVLRGLLDDE